MKTIIYYNDPPRQIRIKSEKLCLDHIFYTEFSKPYITFEDIQALLSSPLIDEVWLYIVGGDLLYLCCDSKQLEPVGIEEGCWFHLDPEGFELVDLEKINIWDIVEP